MDYARNMFDAMPERESSLVSMYAKNGETLNSELVFNEMVVKNIVSWTAMTAAYVKNGFYKEGLSLLQDMVASGSQPNVGYTARASFGALNTGKWLHELSKGKALEPMFQSQRHSLTWARASHGHGNDAFMLFSMMKEKGIKPINSFTFTAVLTACRQSGLVHEGRKHFESMIKDYSLVPGVEHYACMVDLLGQAG
ncbi:pentatricopeptide repeat-containing protein At5g66520 [Rosa chinensis]|uniref:pentatricopeptide repeat-containing protein At5g66520 n=1 Tax=Rosa chinensis TaxID=74649 RepID=UPI000D08EC1A|nr:pentatricopeptide repeat-containing protein At5g66520 [Rosa chinensis]